MVILASTALIESQSAMDKETERQTHSKTDASTTANMREELHTVAREKSCAVLNFARFDSLVYIVARSREKSRSLSLVPFLARYRSLSLSLTGLGMGMLPITKALVTSFSLISKSMTFKDFLSQGGACDTCELFYDGSCLFIRPRSS